MRKTILLMLFLIQFGTIAAQDFHYCGGELVKFPKGFKVTTGYVCNYGGFTMAGYCNGKIVFQYRDTTSLVVSKLYYDETSNSITNTFNLMDDNCYIEQIMQSDDLTLMFGLINLEPNSHNDGKWTDCVWINIDDSSRIIYSDWDINEPTFISPSLDKRIVFTRFGMIDYWWTDPVELPHVLSADGKVTELDIRQAWCPRIVNDTAYYTQLDYDLFVKSDGDCWKFNIFRTPINNTKNSEMIAERAELLATDETGRYILAKKDFYGKDEYFMIDAYTKTMELIANEHIHSLMDEVFYSKQLKKFCLVEEEGFLYLDIPKVFTFNSVGYSARAMSSGYKKSQSDKLYKFDLKIDPIPAVKPLYLRVEQEKLSDTELQQMTKDELRIARNTIFARHGYSFKSADLQEYFGQFYWYNPLNRNNIESELSDIERYNLDLIKKYEQSQN